MASENIRTTLMPPRKRARQFTKGGKLVSDYAVLEFLSEDRAAGAIETAAALELPYQTERQNGAPVHGHEERVAAARHPHEGDRPQGDPKPSPHRHRVAWRRRDRSEPMSHDHMFTGCTGTCMQGRQPCDCRDELANGCTRTTQPGELAPNPPDRAEGVSAGKAALIAVGLTAACLVLALVAHAVASYLKGVPL
jgi:hypothetical protein